MTRRSALLSWLVWLAAVTAYACGGGGENSSGTNGSGAAGAGGSGAGTGGGVLDAGDENIFTDHGPMIALEVDPPSSVIDVKNGVDSPVDFKAIATFGDGAKLGVTADWTFD